MLGTKIRSWMEAHIVRPRKKQHRKDAAAKKRNDNENGKEISESVRQDTQVSFVPEEINKNALNGRSKTEINSDQVRSAYQRSNNNNTNLSSPESAYSTGYSTDGTSPGTSFPPASTAPEYYINIRTGTRYFHSSSSDSVPLRLLVPGTTIQPQKKNAIGIGVAVAEPSTASGRIVSPALTSPRQRNRIRTNPWVITGNSACNCSPVHTSVTSRQLVPVISQPTPMNGSKTGLFTTTASPIRRKWTCNDKKQRCMKCGVCSRFEAFSSSSSSSLSVNSVNRAAGRTSIGSDDEDDHTLNEMMGKYDESYVYEKETDILSDSDPTDCDEEYDDTDADAGRDGGDEQDPLTDEDDFDFIDNGSLELNVLDECGSGNGLVNMGNCTYHSFQEEQVMGKRRDLNKVSGCRRSAGGTPAPARRKRSERRSRHVSSKKRRDRHISVSPFPEQQITPVTPLIMSRARCIPNAYMDGSRSAGATPISVRRRKAALSEQTTWLSRSIDKQRHNSISHTRRPRIPLDSMFNDLELDKEADKKYKELIIEAEHILMAMRTGSPPVASSPARRAALAPTNKRVELLRNEECGGSVDALKTNQLNCISSGDISVKFSPKKNHITNFIHSNAPMAMPMQLPALVPVPFPVNGSAKSSVPLMSPRRAPLVTLKPAPDHLQRPCPQSEPVKRKVYAPIDAISDIARIRPSPLLMFVELETHKTLDGTQKHEKTVVQRQKLLHTITSLKKSMGNQSDTLRHAYNSGSIQQRSSIPAHHQI